MLHTPCTMQATANIGPMPATPTVPAMPRTTCRAPAHAAAQSIEASATAQPEPAPCVRGILDHRASGADDDVWDERAGREEVRFDDLCDEWEGRALRRLQLGRLSSSASAGAQLRYGSKRHVRLTLRDTWCGPKLW